MKPYTTLAYKVVGIMVFAFATAASAQSTARTFDVSVLAAACANCHGPAGRSTTAIPPLAGQPEAHLRQQLHAFKNNPPAHTTVMDRLVAELSDEQLDALAQYFSATRPSTKAGVSP